MVPVLADRINRTLTSFQNVLLIALFEKMLHQYSLVERGKEETLLSFQFSDLFLCLLFHSFNKYLSQAFDNYVFAGNLLTALPFYTIASFFLPFLLFTSVTSGTSSFSPWGFFCPPQRKKIYLVTAVTVDVREEGCRAPSLAGQVRNSQVLVSLVELE